jgi:DNA repair protein RecN (Recombination protein N)
MISTLHIKNIGIIDDLSIDFNEGFNVLTGETGAGKTLIISSLGIIAGGRFSKEMIRKGEEHSLIEVNIFYPQSEYAEDGNIIVSREMYSNGRNTCKINGKLVTVAELKSVMSKIIDIHGQHDNQNLLNNMQHIYYLDGFIGEELKEIKKEYQEDFNKFNDIKNKFKGNYGDNIEKERRLDLLRYQYKEIDGANLRIGEDLELKEKHKIMMNSEKLRENLKIIDESINSNAIEYISNSIRCLEKIESYGETYKNKLNELKNIYYELQETARDLGSLKDETDFNEYERDEVERRLDIIFSLKRKYGNTIDEILEYKDKLENEIKEIENLEETNKKLRLEQKQVESKMKKLCDKMQEIRSKNGQALAKRINKELKDLEMPNVKFNIKIEKQDNYTINGNDKVEFVICTNVGEEYKELVKIASGGEMSRIMLAIKTVLADIDEVPILIFDEIDTGISGKASKAVAEKMKIISKKRQILCITHLPAIAAQGESNYYIYKEIKDDKTKTNIKQLNEEETIYEIARISNGDITKVAIENAKELRKVC